MLVHRSARTRPTTLAEAGAPIARAQLAATSETSMDGSTSSAVDNASANTPDEATTLTCRTPDARGNPYAGR